MNLYVKELSCIQGRLGKDRGKEKCEGGQKEHIFVLYIAAYPGAICEH